MPQYYPEPNAPGMVPRRALPKPTNWLERAGIEPESPLGRLGRWTPSDPIEALRTGIQSGWEGLTKAPQTRVPITTPTGPAAPAMFQQAGRAPIVPQPPAQSVSDIPSARFGEFDLPRGMSQEGTTRGYISPFSVGNNEEALAGLRQASSRTAGWQPSTEDLYKRAFPRNDPNSPYQVSYGMSPQQAGQQLQERIGEEAFSRALGQKQQEALTMGQTAMHPAIQAGEEARAQRAAYPSQVAGQAQQFAAMLGLQGRQELAGAQVERARMEREGRVQSMLLQVKQRLLSNMAQYNLDDENTQRMQEQIAELDNLLRLSRLGVFSLSDYIGDMDLGTDDLGIEGLGANQ